MNLRERSLYTISGTAAGEFGRYIATNPVNAIEAEYLLLKICFEQLGLNAVYCQTNFENKAVWGQHLKLGFKEKGTKDVTVERVVNYGAGRCPGNNGRRVQEFQL